MSDLTPRPTPSAAPESALLANLRKHANAGDAHAQFELGVHYGAGLGKPPDFATAASWDRRAADQDHPLAQFNLGIMAARGQGMAADDLASAGWMLKAAQGGDAGGQYHLGSAAATAPASIPAARWIPNPASKATSGSNSPPPRATRTPSPPGNPTMTMSRAGVTEGNQRTAAFVPRPRPSDQPAPALPLS